MKENKQNKKKEWHTKNEEEEKEKGKVRINRIGEERRRERSIEENWIILKKK